MTNHSEHKDVIVNKIHEEFDKTLGDRVLEDMSVSETDAHWNKTCELVALRYIGEQLYESAQYALTWKTV